MSAESPETEAYLKSIEEEVEKAYKAAQIARQQCKDPEPDVEISLAADLASRVEGLLGFKGVAEKIREFNTNFSREEVALKIAEEIAAGKIGTFEDKEKAIECAIRIALAILTEAVVAAPIEGISRVKIKENSDRTKYLAVYFAGPIRSAGGTAEAFTVLVGDKLRQLLNLDRYKPSEKEIERYVEEVELYETEAAHLQYPSTPDEIRFAVKNLPIEITGEPTDKIEVTGYRDLERVETNQVRGGAILVLVEGVLSKATKIAKLAEELKLEGWSWIKELAQKRVEKKSTKEPITPKYLEDVIGGRPILAYPNQPGGFRLRYGRCRNSGLAAQSIHPATMVILDEFIAVGTQIKTERPGKAAAIVPCDTIEGPIVKLKTGDVIYVNTLEEAYKLKDQVAEILFLGDILISYGEFLENNHPLMPSGYSEEIWQQELEKVAKQSNTLDVYQIKMYIEDSIKNVPTAQEAIQLSEKFRIPLHPRYTYYWHDISAESILKLVDWIVSGEFSDSTLKLPISEEKKLLEMLGIPHKISNNLVALDSNESQILLRCLGLDEKLSKQRFEEVYTSRSWADPVELVSALAGFSVRKKAPTKIGARMARPEKANMRMMKPAPHFLFPLGWAGGKTRNTIKATKNGTITVDIVYRKCPICKKTTFKPKCICGGRTRITSPSHKDQGLLIKDLLEEAAKNIHENIPEEIKGVVGLISRDKVPEPLEKGILRAKYDLHVFRDGTIRFDATNLPLTHFRPSEIKTDVEKLKQLGYRTDCYGKPLLNGDQIIELKQQDLVIPEKGGECLVKITKFIDEMLAKFYNLSPYYNVNKIEDLVGHLVVGLAPHTSVGVIGRIIGFTRADACFAHPYFHAAKR
ncbi:MAG: DNA polymerase II large subunit, partial [Euryarchaeota archaeon]|nr:DNA polymerase II large subunit [Euryarchaeota archaeon]